MSLFGGVISISNISTLLFVVFAVLMAGYALGRITVKGISLGDAGVFMPGYTGYGCFSPQRRSTDENPLQKLQAPYLPFFHRSC